MNDAQRHFCREYVKTHNGTQSYLTAYPNATSDAGRTNASKLLANTNIQNYIAELEEEHLQRFDYTMDDVLREIATIAFAPVGDDNVRTADKLKALIELKSHFDKRQPTGNEDTPNTFDSFIDALNISASQIWNDRGNEQ